MARYHIPKDIQEYVDYMSPGVRLLEAAKANPARESAY